jgi:lipopolysaccharide/colanic/teichoic acid biosynthesis glycosyltransferase
VSDQILSLVELQDLDGVPLLGRQSMEMPPGPRFRKRMLDLSLAIPLLAITSPLLLLLSPFIRRSTGGTALVGVSVAGVGDRPFRLYRIRTMPAEVKPELHRIPGDARLTWAGRWARRTLLEIAPELWNVVRGDLSMVGPRPLTLRESASLEPEHRFRKTLPPGLTGLWKIDPRPRIGALDELELDLLYLRLRSFLFDITVILRSLDEILRRPPRV